VKQQVKGPFRRYVRNRDTNLEILRIQGIENLIANGNNKDEILTR
jgi:hypothetical protein